MISGNPLTFAIESQITLAYERPSLLALGLFVLHILGRKFGIQSDEATLLACSYDEVGERLSRRGSHVAPFCCEEAQDIVSAFCDSVYRDNSQTYFGLSGASLRDAFYSQHIIWAPDGEGFDDGSYVLHFDIVNDVRILAFRRTGQMKELIADLVDLWMPQDEFYNILTSWRQSFDDAWQKSPKAENL